jgi:hypothetical protein
MNINELIEAAKTQLPDAFYKKEINSFPEEPGQIITYKPRPIVHVQENSNDDDVIFGSGVVDKDNPYGEEVANEEDIAELDRTVVEQGTESLALYISFHEPLPDNRWGIFIIGESMWRLREKIRYELGSWGLPYPTQQVTERLAEDMVLSHERYHFWFDLYATHQELTTHRPLYLIYSHNVYPAVRLTSDCYEESLSNCAAVTRARALQRRNSKSLDIYRALWPDYVSNFCSNQPPGYRDWDRPRDELNRKLGGQLHSGLTSVELAEPQALWVSLNPEVLKFKCPVYMIPRTQSARNGLELTIRIAGNQWRLHRYDPDPWPCVPHAINPNGEKLNPFTGEVFDARNKRPIRKLAKSELELVQAGIRNKWPDISV